MEQEQKKGDFKKLLDRLQEDSWQLELLISGFAIFGLFYAFEPVSHQLNVAFFDDNKTFLNFFIVVRFSLQILIFNLLLHVLVRGMWIGSLGLRYVFGDIDFDKLNYGSQFTKYLKKNVSPFDVYISKLENFCSVIFALTFLLVFYVFSFFIIAFILVAFQTPVADWILIPYRILFVFLSIGVILTMVDFLTQGFLKKNKWLAKFYFPFYWVFSFLTLSFLYRPLVYNLLDSKLGRRISIVLVPVYLLIYVVFHLNFQKSNFVTSEIATISNSNISFGRNYQDVIEKNDRIFIGDFAIQSKVITEPYLKLVVPLTSRMEDGLVAFNANLTIEKDKRGLQFKPEIIIKTGRNSIETFNEEYLNTFENKYIFKIDSSFYKTEFVINTANGDLTFESYIGIKGLSEGKHTLEFQSFYHQDSDSLVSIGKIPFWYFKE